MECMFDSSDGSNLCFCENITKKTNNDLLQKEPFPRSAPDFIQGPRVLFNMGTTRFENFRTGKALATHHPSFTLRVSGYMFGATELELYIKSTARGLSMNKKKLDKVYISLSSDLTLR